MYFLMTSRVCEGLSMYLLLLFVKHIMVSKICENGNRVIHHLNSVLEICLCFIKKHCNLHIIHHLLLIQNVYQ